MHDKEKHKTSMHQDKERKIIQHSEDEKTMITWEEEANNFNDIKDHLSALRRKGTSSFEVLNTIPFYLKLQIFYTIQVLFLP